MCGAYEAVEIGDSQTLAIQLYCRSCGEKSYALRDEPFKEKEKNHMDEHSGISVHFYEIAKKINEGKFGEIKPEDIAAITKSSNFFDFWPFLVLMLMGGYNFGSSGADYWRGKYDAYKELHEGNTNNKEKN